MLEEGGNAVDACVAAAFAGWVAESPLTGPGAGGFALVRPGDGGRRASRTSSSPRRASAGPSRRAPRCTRSTSASAATARRRRSSGSARRPAPCPGAAAGLEAVHEAYGRLPWAELARSPRSSSPATGVELSRPQAHLHAILDLILRHTAEGRRLYSRAGRLAPAAGRRAAAARPRRDARAHRGGGSRRRSTAASSRATIASTVAAGGGTLTADDLAAYRVVWRRAGARAATSARGDLEPAAVLGRHPDRLRARAARARRRAARRAPPRRSPRSSR